MIMLISWWWWWRWWFFHSKIGPHLVYPGFHRLFMRGFRFRLSIKKWATRKVFSKSFFSRLRHSCLRPKTCRPAADEAPHHTREKTSVTQGTPSHKWPLSHSSLFVGRCVDLATSRVQLFSRALSASGRFFVLCGKSERESESSTCFACKKSHQVTSFWRELFASLSRVSSRAVKVCQNKQITETKFR